MNDSDIPGRAPQNVRDASLKPRMPHPGGRYETDGGPGESAANPDGLTANTPPSTRGGWSILGGLGPLALLVAGALILALGALAF